MIKSAILPKENDSVKYLFGRSYMEYDRTHYMHEKCRRSAKTKEFSKTKKPISYKLFIFQRSSESKKTAS